MTARIKHAVQGLQADTPILLAARRVIKCRLAAVEQYLSLVTAEPANNTESIHQLRVATRRAGAALKVLRGYFDPKLHDRARRLLRRIRRAAGSARTDDVHLERLQKENVPAELNVARECLLSDLSRSRAEAQQAMDDIARRRMRTLRALRRRLIRSLAQAELQSPNDGQQNGAPYNLRELAAVGLLPAIKRFQEAFGGDLDDIAAIHKLRIAAKGLRYSIETLAQGLPEGPAARAHQDLQALQDRLGEINDRSELADRLTALAVQTDKNLISESDEGARLHAGLLNLCEQERCTVARDHRDLLAWLGDESALAFLKELMDTLSPTPNQDAPCGTVDEHGANRSAAHRRIAAIDVGTNSVRLVIAETDPAVPFHIVEDVKETTRLGTGVYATGRLQSQAIDATIAALERMRKVAEAKHVEQIRAVGTSAVREAVNRAEFLELTLQRTGIDIEVLDAEDEARLAFSSVANSFELDDRCVAVADIGGGSTELILSTGGVIDSIYPLPLGAVRLTELYGGTPGKGEYRYDEMIQGVGRTLSERMHRSRHCPYLIIGTGGTFTSLARVALHQDNPGAHVRFSFALGGHEFRRADVTRLLDWLRGMTLDERKRVPGLSSGRAEIIVAGVCIVDRLMQFFGVDRLRVHDGGIRDGLLAQMFDEMGIYIAAPRIHGADSIESIRQFARRCEYDAAHSEHVAFLSLRIFDQLAGQGPGFAGIWSRPENRSLLHAAAIAHDVGMLIHVERHHRHSYDLLMHADLPVFTRREIEIIANICRYHRRRGPKRKDPNFSRLGDDDQRIVAHLAGILRIADGMDRTHQNAVTDVVVSVNEDEVAFEAVAESKPRPELRYAKKKADLFEAAFHIRTLIEWAPNETVLESEMIGAAI